MLYILAEDHHFRIIVLAIGASLFDLADEILGRLVFHLRLSEKLVCALHVFLARRIENLFLDLRMDREHLADFLSQTLLLRLGQSLVSLVVLLEEGGDFVVVVLEQLDRVGGAGAGVRAFCHWTSPELGEIYVEWKRTASIPVPRNRAAGRGLRRRRPHAPLALISLAVPGDVLVDAVPVHEKDEGLVGLGLLELRGRLRGCRH